MKKKDVRTYNNKGVKFKECYYEDDALCRMVWYFTDGNIDQERYICNDKEHREDGPAIITNYSNGKVFSHKYYIEGKLHRIDGPAYIEYYADGNIELEEYIINGNDHHRIGGPAYIEYDKNGNIKYEEYWLNGKKYDVFQYYVAIAAM